MKDVLVDTCVWSLVLRGASSKQSGIVEQLAHLIDKNQVRIIGPIRQELLSGYSDKRHYDKLRQKMSSFPNEPIIDADYEAAAEFSNVCRANGVLGSHIDFLICAFSSRTQFQIFTIDKNFDNYSKHLPITLYKPTSR
jgi:hypothetical protein